jgi:hypothetical protein
MTDLVVAAPVSVPDVMTMADVIVKSGLFPAFKNRESAAAMMLLCRAKGLDPMTAVERYHIVQGRPVMRADAMLGEFVRMGGRVEWIKRDDTEASATFSHPQGGSVTVSWTIEMARKAKLTGKDIWSQYPRQMLHARCVSEGVRSVLPGATNGLYTPEEAMQMEPVGDLPSAPAKPAVRAISRDSEAVAALPAPAPAPVAEPAIDAKKLLVLAMQDFADAATERGWEIASANGKPSKSKMVALAGKLVTGFDAADPEHWALAQDALVETGDDEPVDAPAPADDNGLVLEAEIVTRDADTSGEFTIEDPFADE